MVFDRHRRMQSSPPVYRFFPNRTPGQTRALSWAALGVCSFLTIFFLKAFEHNDEKLKSYYQQLQNKNPNTHTQAQVSIVIITNPKP